VVWSFLLLGETLRGGQFVGIPIALSGLLVFIVINQHVNSAGRRHWWCHRWRVKVRARRSCSDLTTISSTLRRSA
jgi:hypothetical protein